MKEKNIFHCYLIPDSFLLPPLLNKTKNKTKEVPSISTAYSVSFFSTKAIKNLSFKSV